MTDNARQTANRWLVRGQDFEAQARAANDPTQRAELRKHAAYCFAKAEHFRAVSNAAQRRRRERANGAR